EEAEKRQAHDEGFALEARGRNRPKARLCCHSSADDQRRQHTSRDFQGSEVANFKRTITPQRQADKSAVAPSRGVVDCRDHSSEEFRRRASTRNRLPESRWR